MDDPRLEAMVALVGPAIERRARRVIEAHLEALAAVVAATSPGSGRGGPTSAEIARQMADNDAVRARRERQMRRYGIDRRDLEQMVAGGGRW